MPVRRVACADTGADGGTLAGMTRTGRPKAELTLTDQDKAELQRRARRATSGQALALRARIVLACARGRDNKEVAAALGCHPATAGKWRSRFIAGGLAGLSDEERSGRRVTVTDEQVEAVIVATLEETPKDATRWSRASMAGRSGLSSSTIGRIWKAFKLKPHLTSGFKLSAAEWKKFLQKIDREVPAGLEVHIVADNYATRKTPMIQKWLADHPRFTMHFTPTSSSWLNQVERWFGLITDKMIRRGARRSVQALEADIRAWIDNWNENPRPFTWTKTADEILASLGRLLQRNSGEGH